MNYEIQARLQSELQSGEKLLWWGQPAQGLRLRPADALLIPFSFLWAGFAFYWEWSVLQQDAPGFFALWGIPFVLVGLYVAVGRFFVDAWQRARTYYALTPERAIIIRGAGGREVKSLPLRTLTSISLREGRGRYGTITLGAGPAWPGSEWFGGSGWPGTSRHQVPAFDLIEDARRVHDLLHSAQREANRAGA